MFEVEKKCAGALLLFFSPTDPDRTSPRYRWRWRGRGRQLFSPFLRDVAHWQCLMRTIECQISERRPEHLWLENTGHEADGQPVELHRNQL